MADQDPYAVETYTDEWGIPLEQLGESDIDDEDGDMILEQHLTVYNKVTLSRFHYDVDRTTNTLDCRLHWLVYWTTSR